MARVSRELWRGLGISGQEFFGPFLEHPRRTFGWGTAVIVVAVMLEVIGAA